MKIHLFKFLFILIICHILSGCWDQRELRGVSIVSGVGVDLGKHHKYKMTVEVLNPTELSPKKAAGNAASVVYSAEGDTLHELSHRMNTAISKKLIYSHMRTLVISEQIAKEGVLDFIDFLERNREIRDDFNLIIAKDISAEDVLKVTYPFQKSSSLKLSMQLDTAMKDAGVDPNIRLKDVVSALTSKGRNPVATVVTVTGSPEQGNKMDNDKMMKPAAIVEITNLAIFKKEKLLGYADINDTRNYLWTQGLVQLTSISVPCDDNQTNQSDVSDSEQVKEQEKKFFALRIYDSKTNIKAKYIGDKPKIDMFLSVESRIDGLQCPDNLEDPKTILKLEDKAKKWMEQDIEGTIKKIQTKYKVDSFGFGEDMMRQDYSHFKKVQKHWDEEFARADIDVHVNIKIRRTGIRTKSFKDTMKENETEGGGGSKGSK